MEYKESKLFPILKEHFKAEGFKVYTEVANKGCFVDVVAEEGELQIAIELKMSLTKGVIRQAYYNQIRTNHSYVGVPTNPRKENIEYCRKRGIGIFIIKDSVDEILEPNAHFKIREKFHTELLTEGEVSGLPQMKGEGPGIMAEKNVRDYLLSHPKAKWKEIFENVSNHYAHYKSLRQVMNMRGINLITR